MRVKFLDQREIRSEYQVIFWYTFLTEDIDNKVDDLLIEFIHSDCFREFGKPSIVSQSHIGGDRFLQGAFNLNNLDVTNFRIFSKDGLMQFFDEYSQSADWGDDRGEFIDVMNSFNKFLEKETSDCFFGISKEWFNQGDRVLSADSGFYTYYFLLMWLDIGKKIINVCEWNYD